MLFHSNVFLKFLAAFLLAYLICRRDVRRRNRLIVAASYLFYGWWDYRFLGLIVLSSLVDYGIGLRLAAVEAPGRRRRLLGLSLLVNLGILGLFKYYDFFVASLAGLLPVDPGLLRLTLPVGISFYTFQTISYTFDVYRREITPTRDLVAFLAYVAFFPQLVAGPIERARRLLPQFLQPTPPVDGEAIQAALWLVLWGMFKKVVVADNLAPLVDIAYGASAPGALLVLVGTLAFGVQIYCDFSGYSDIARGLARGIGFDLMLNFHLPYLAASPREFWQRWHISLSTWFRDYLYIPLGGNRRGAPRTAVNLAATMVLAGLWHGAAWTFVAWGAWHGAGLALHRFALAGRLPAGRARTGAGWLATQLFVLYGWLLFRAESLAHAGALTAGLVRGGAPGWIGDAGVVLAVFSAPVLLIQAWQRWRGDLLAPLRLPAPWRGLLQAALLLAVILYWESDSAPFIYFQF